jgi:hypothetical protein
MTRDFDEMFFSGKINEYFRDQLSRNAHYFPEDLQDEYVDTAQIMSNLYIHDNEGQRAFLIILQHTPDVLMEIAAQAPRSQDIAKVAARVFGNLKKYPIKTLPELFLAVAYAAKDLGIELKESVLKKLAYPQSYEGTIPKSPYDINKWMQATRDIYLGIDRGKSRAQAYSDVTKDWDKMESNDYKYWLKFYEENVPNKYPKIAQQNNISFDSLMSRLPVPNPYKHGDVKPIETELAPKESPKESPKPPAEDARQKIEIQRARIISRLNAAEKMLASLDGQMFAGEEQEFMLKLLQDLKRKVQTANKITIKSSLFEDFIYRAANQLKIQGKRVAAGFIYKIAQPVPEEMGLGDMGGPPMDMGGFPTDAPPEGAGAVEETDEALEEFFENMRTGIFSKKDPKINKKNAGEIIVEAQATEPIGVAADPGPPDPRSRAPIGPPPEEAPPTPELTPEATPVEAPADIEVEEEPDADPSGTEDAIELALQNVTVGDVIARLEMVASFYKKREMSRQLSYIDIEMDKLGIVSFFPGLGEAMAKALEANQYISTRVEEILSRLKGSLSTPTEKLLGKEEAPPPEQTAGLRGSLQAQQEQEAERKERRKQHEAEKLERRTAPPAPPAENMAELAAPPENIERPPTPVPTR